jgi:predicted nucleotidyltransferase
LNRDYKELLKELNDAEVEYLLVGAHALAFHVEPRYTKDLDVWVNPTPKNAERVYRALARFGAPLQGVKAADFSTPGLVYQLGLEPVRVDVLTSCTGLDFNEAHGRRAAGSYEDVPFPVLSLTDLIANKEATGRPQDLVDLEHLRRKLDRT